MKPKLRTHFISGLVVLAPLFLTILVINYLVRLTDNLIVNPVFQMLPISDLDVTFKIFLAKLAIATLVILFVMLIGIGAERFFIRQFLVAGEALIKSIPIFNKVYGSIKEIAQAFFGDKKGVFKRVVFVEYPRKGVYSLGFVTQDRPWKLNELVQKDILSVFIPSPPNPATGLAIFVPREELIESTLTIEEGIKIVISCGAAVPGGKRPASTQAGMSDEG